MRHCSTAAAAGKSEVKSVAKSQVKSVIKSELRYYRIPALLLYCFHYSRGAANIGKAAFLGRQ
jgi:hypothetical protein